MDLVTKLQSIRPGAEVNASYRAGYQKAVEDLANLLKNKVAIPDTLPENSCNQHNDCRKADEEARAKGATFGASHCHDENCEDCFGC